jgi:hypothetical protein
MMHDTVTRILTQDDTCIALVTVESTDDEDLVLLSLIRRLQKLHRFVVHPLLLENVESCVLSKERVQHLDRLSGYYRISK